MSYAHAYIPHIGHTHIARSVSTPPAVHTGPEHLCSYMSCALSRVYDCVCLFACRSRHCTWTRVRRWRRCRRAPKWRSSSTRPALSRPPPPRRPAVRPVANPLAPPLHRCAQSRNCAAGRSRDAIRPIATITRVRTRAIVARLESQRNTQRVTHTIVAVLRVYCVGYAVELTLSEQFWEEDELRVNATWSVSPAVTGALTQLLLCSRVEESPGGNAPLSP